MLREHIPGALAAALGTAVVGVLLVVYQPGNAGDAAGVALTVSAVGACALYTVITRRLLLDDASLPLVLVQQVAALPFAVLLATVVQLATGNGWSIEKLPGSTWATAAASGILYYGLAFWFYLAGLRQVPASVAGAFLPLIPVFGVAAGYLVGERLAGRQWTGAAIVVLATAAIAPADTIRPEVDSSPDGRPRSKPRSSARRSRRVRFMTAAALVKELIEARDSHTQTRDLVGQPSFLTSSKVSTPEFHWKRIQPTVKHIQERINWGHSRANGRLPARQFRSLLKLKGSSVFLSYKGFWPQMACKGLQV